MNKKVECCFCAIPLDIEHKQHQGKSINVGTCPKCKASWRVSWDRSETILSGYEVLDVKRRKGYCIYCKMATEQISIHAPYFFRCERCKRKLHFNVMECDHCGKDTIISNFPNSFELRCEKCGKTRNTLVFLKRPGFNSEEWIKRIKKKYKVKVVDVTESE